jgi:hypothetical protein
VVSDEEATNLVSSGWPHSFRACDVNVEAAKVLGAASHRKHGPKGDFFGETGAIEDIASFIHSRITRQAHPSFSL